MSKKTIFHSLPEIDYKECWDLQESLFNRILSEKRLDKTDIINHLIFCQHPHVYTLGKSGSEDNMLIDYIQLLAKNATFHKINRGGDITYHGPGQLVGYPILNLTAFKMGIKDYIYNLEEAIILSLQQYDIHAERLENAIGVWLDVKDPKKVRKICAIGVRTSHWVSMHGLALNVNTDLNYFNYIHPCGFTDKAVTSLEKELGKKLDFEEVSAIVKLNLQKVFNFEFIKNE
ncbi:MAG: lipoyl(octanoyl) transferase LipB [Bacteroidales bacterium]